MVTQKTALSTTVDFGAFFSSPFLIAIVLLLTEWHKLIVCSFGMFGYGKYVIVPFWLTSVTNQSDLVSPGVLWLNINLLIMRLQCAKNIHLGDRNNRRTKKPRPPMSLM